MLETDKRIGHISGHRKGNTSISMDGGIVPLEGEPKVEGAGPVSLHRIRIVKDLFKMEGVVLVDIFNTKVVNA